MTCPDKTEAFLSHWGGRPTVAVIDLNQLHVNIGAFRTLIGDDVSFMAVVKADGYGHGAIPVARASVAAGANELGVATVEEGVQLRAAGVEAPILVMGPVGSAERPRAIRHRLTLVVANLAFARGLEADAKMMLRREPLDVHLKIDTGMRRFGATGDDVLRIARMVHRSKHLRLAAVMTHLANADDPDPAFAREQVSRFDAACDGIREAGITIPSVHIANSAGTLKYLEMHRDKVRVGISLYGLLPDARMRLPAPMRPIMRIFSRLARVFTVQAGESVSYGRTWTADKPTRLGLVPIGYADGYRRQGSNATWMDVRGVKAPVRGRVCMDQTVIEVPPEARIGDLVEVIGDGESGMAPSLDQLAPEYGTISYELATSLLAPRMPHLYLQDDKLIAVRDLSGYRELDEAALSMSESQGHRTNPQNAANS